MSYMLQHLMRENPSFYHLAWMFLLGGILGELVEMLFCKAISGKWQRRSSLIHCHLSIVWSLAFGLATVALCNTAGYSASRLFFIGTVAGGIFEFLCSVFTEYAMGAVFWDYSKMRYQLQGRVNLTYCVFWGAAAVVWAKVGCPVTMELLAWIPREWGIQICSLLTAVVSVDMVVTFLAMRRYGQRKQGQQGGCALDRWLDRMYPDRRMEDLFENMQLCKGKEAAAACFSGAGCPK